jgi:anti-sigma factor RsiW
VPPAAEVLGLLQTKRVLRATAPRYVPSPEFRLRMEQSMRAKRKPLWFSIPFPRLAMAAVAAMLLIASVTVWVNHYGREREFTEISDLHVTDLASANPVDVVSTDNHTVKPWFEGKLPFSFNLPELQNSAFTLTGGRVAYFDRSSGAQLLFNLRKHKISVFIFKDERREPVFYRGAAISARFALHMESWSEGGLRYFIVSDSPASDVQELSELLRRADRL